MRHRADVRVSSDNDDGRIMRVHCSVTYVAIIWLSTYANYAVNDEDWVINKTTVCVYVWSCHDTSIPALSCRHIAGLACITTTTWKRKAGRPRCNRLVTWSMTSRDLERLWFLCSELVAWQSNLDTELRWCSGQGVGLVIEWSPVRLTAAFHCRVAYRSTQPSILLGYIDKSNTRLLGLGRGRVHLCRVAGNTVWSHMG